MLATFLTGLSSGDDGVANPSVTAVINHSGSNVTTTAQGGPFGNSVEVGGTYAITLKNGGAATANNIKTQLFKKVNNAWVSQGDQTAVPMSDPMPLAGSWSQVRYKNLAAGEYKVVIDLSYDVTNPMPATPNPQTASTTWSGTFE